MGAIHVTKKEGQKSLPFCLDDPLGRKKAAGQPEDQPDRLDTQSRQTDPTRFSPGAGTRQKEAEDQRKRHPEPQRMRQDSQPPTDSRHASHDGSQAPKLASQPDGQQHRRPQQEESADKTGSTHSQSSHGLWQQNPGGNGSKGHPPGRPGS